MDIAPEHLLFPWRMAGDGLAFVRAHGLDDTTLGSLRRGARQLANGLVRIQHRCQHLTPNNLCAIYADRPAICRAYICEARPDCVKESA